MFWPGISLWIKSHTNSSWCPNIDQFQVIYLLLQNFWNISKSKNYANLSNTNKGSNETIFLLKFSKINVTKAKKIIKNSKISNSQNWSQIKQVSNICYPNSMYKTSLPKNS